jgi:hypothetical protein
MYDNSERMAHTSCTYMYYLTELMNYERYELGRIMQLFHPRRISLRPRIGLPLVQFVRNHSPQVDIRIFHIDSMPLLYIVVYLIRTSPLRS